MKKSIAKNYISKVIATVFCLMMLAYVQCGYAGVIESIYDDIDTGIPYIEIFPDYEDSLVSSKVAMELTTRLTRKSSGMLVESVCLPSYIELLPGAFDTLMNGIRTSETLRHIRFLGVNIGTRGIKLLSEYLISNKQIKTLVLTKVCSIEDNHIDDNKAHCIRELLLRTRR